VLFIWRRFLDLFIWRRLVFFFRRFLFRRFL
jgi:hypothetical protein